jgi:hypothetical protein
LLPYGWVEENFCYVLPPSATCLPKSSARMTAVTMTAVKIVPIDIKKINPKSLLQRALLMQLWYALKLFAEAKEKFYYYKFSFKPLLKFYHRFFLL